MLWFCCWMIALSTGERDIGGSDRLDETGHLVGQLLGPGRDPCPVGRTAPAAANDAGDGPVAAAGAGRCCGRETSSSGSAMPGSCAAAFR